MSSITIHGVNYETIYDTEQEISLPCPCINDTPTVNNINLSALQYILKNNPHNLWSEESLQDFQDFLDNEPADKIFITIGEIILSPKNNPSQYYKFNQDKNKNGKTYLTVEKLKTAGKKAKRARKAKTPKKQKDKLPHPPKEIAPKPQEIALTNDETPKTAEKQKTLNDEALVIPKRRTRTIKKPTEEIEIIDPECFFLMKMAEAMEEYCRLTFPSDLKKYKRLTK